jgi:hypothetical protein
LIGSNCKKRSIYFFVRVFEYFQCSIYIIIGSEELREKQRRRNIRQGDMEGREEERFDCKSKGRKKERKKWQKLLLFVKNGTSTVTDG